MDLTSRSDAYIDEWMDEKADNLYHKKYNKNHYFL